MKLVQSVTVNLQTQITQRLSLPLGNQITEVSKPTNSTSTVQNNKNNALTTPVNEVNLISNVNDKPVNTTELNHFATPYGVAPIVETKTDYSNVMIIGAGAAILTGIVLVGATRSKRGLKL